MSWVVTLVALLTGALSAAAGWLYVWWEINKVSGDASEELQRRATRYRLWMRRASWSTGVLLLLTAGVLIGQWFRSPLQQPPTPTSKTLSAADEAELRRVVRESQVLEFLTLERAPDKAGSYHDLLSKYWLSTADGGREIVNVQESVERLRQRGWHYGPESQVEQFAFMSIMLKTQEDAEVRTRERWSLPLYDKAGRRVPGKNQFFGPYDVVYKLKLVNGQWLIAETTTPRSK